ncbi:MAG: phosphoenolpyruvate synthase [Sphingobacteriales bacterium]|nr:phosphoenolpyruvate synthase [Sphingobacteriales bacterium]OJW32236.1 MAG: phosphoenolpyruvate synthase [Sphingobacteriales bacterium 46-32]
MSVYIRSFNTIGLSDIPAVGGKNASLGEMISQLASRNIPVPEGYAVTAEAFEDFLTHNQLHKPLQQLMQELDKTTYANLRTIGARARQLMLAARLPQNLQDAILDAYRQLQPDARLAVAVRSSATAEDLPTASFAGQHESYLNISGAPALLRAVQDCYASLYTDRAIKYREDKGFEHSKVALSVGVQRMVRSDLAGSGVLFTLEPESGFANIVHISSVWGLGENIVQGTVTPDEYWVFKPMLQKGYQPIVQRRLGEKAKTMIYGTTPEAAVVNIDTTPEKRAQYVLTDQEVTDLARWGVIIEKHYGKPMDIEWAKDGQTGKLYIIQARPETVHAREKGLQLEEYRLKSTGEVLVQGQAIGNHIATGIARILQSPAEADRLQPGDIVVTDLTSPDWDPLLKQAGGIITNKGGRTSHASIVARELGVPAIVGCNNATSVIKEGEWVTISCAEGKTGRVYRGQINFEIMRTDFSAVSRPAHTAAMLIAGDPDKAFQLSFYPSDGVGLMRMEFAITHSIQVHPMALVHFNQLSENDQAAIERIVRPYSDKKEFFIDRLAQAIGTMAAAFYPRPVIVRMSDFKTNEYANLTGGRAFEPSEENPMLGFRGASRYYHERYREGFRLECAAISRVRDEMGLTNVKVMIPFCRTPEEGRQVIDTMQSFGLVQHKNGLEVYVMVEIPSNVILASQFAEIFDGFSIGSNDLTQLTLGIDRDSAVISSLFDERNEAARTLIAEAIHKAREAGIPIGLCGQAPSDYPAYAHFLVHEGINSISFNPDAFLEGLQHITDAEKDLAVVKS